MLHQPLAKVSAFLSSAHKMLIGDAWVEAGSRKTFEVRDPATGRVIASVPEGDAGDIDLAVRAARRSFDEKVWRGLTAQMRRQILWRYADLIEKNSEELAHLEVVNNGMPLWFALAIIKASVDAMRYFAGQTATIFGTNYSAAISGGGDNVHAYTTSEPIGIVGVITPWNGPAASFLIKVGMALAAGCSCVAKPAENTPVSALRLGMLALEAGIPPGVLNIVTGFGPIAGQALVDHDQVDKVSFTGSTAVGKRIVQSSAGNLKRVTLELGGKSPCIILDDADVAVAIPGAAMSVFLNSGQMCIAGSRVYAQKKIYDQVVSGIADVARTLKVGSGFDPATQLGPLISAKQLDRVSRYIESGREAGAEIVAGGGCPAGEGYFIEPTVLANVNADMRVVREEIFGPVIAVTPIDDIDEIVRQANDTRYGLAAGIFTTDVNKAHLIAERLQAGNVWVNCYGNMHPTMPFGGYKESGWGRECGSEGLHAFLETKSVRIQLK
jgi:acyl-CoA reductase-like NAD-dependent aldehyde dehydrogenase